MGYRNARDIIPVVASGAFTITNHVNDATMDCNTAADAEICDVLGTLIKQLNELGLINATVTA